MKKVQYLKEERLRSFIRNEIQKIMEQDSEKEAGEEQEEEPQEEESDEDKISEMTSELVRKVKSHMTETTPDDLAMILTQVLNSWGFSNETKLSILKQTKQNTIY